MREGKKVRKRGMFSGVDAERADREKGVKIKKMGENVYPNRYDQNARRAIFRGKGRQVKTTCT